MGDADDDRRMRALLQSARAAASRGDRIESERLLWDAQRAGPTHPLIRNEAAMHLYRSGNVGGAHAGLEALAEAEPGYPEIWLNLAVIRKALNQTDAAVTAIDRALALDGRNLPALLEKGALQEQKGDTRAASVTYFAALQMIPPGADVPPPLRQPFERAKRAVETNNAELESFIETELAPLRARYGRDSLKRFDRCVDMLLRKRRVPRQQPTFLFFPELPAIEFYSRDPFPWLERLEAATSDIRAELETVLAERGAGSLEPYNAGPAGAAAPASRDDPRRWRSYPFWREGVAFPAHMEKCPRTMKAIDACPNWDAPGIGPNAMFSILEGKTRIPPHTGTANTRLVAHLPLIVPPECGFRVGGEERAWRPGEAFVFDDTIEHEAWNDSDEVRAILIVDVWSPLLSAAERELIRALAARVGKYYGTLQDEPAPVSTGDPSPPEKAA